MKTSIKAMLKNIESAEEFLNEDSINQFIEILTTSKNIFVTGAGNQVLQVKHLL